jgi:transposase
VIQAEAKGTGAGCPECRRWSSSIHSHYLRRPHDLPSSGKAIRLTLRVRRFRCHNPKCSRKIFCERLPEVVGVSAQRTERLKSVLKRVGWALGGEAGSRLSQHLGMRASPSTLLRQMRYSPLPVQPTPRVLGVDDFALRRGRSYGTLLVDGETHRPVDLLPDRTSETLANWLRDHPGVEVITRDRSTEYARGASQGAPLATQIANRWHLLVNWREALERTLDRFRSQIVDTPSSVQEVIPLTPYDRSGRRGTKDQVQQQASCARRHALFTQVKDLQRKGLNISQIARQLKLSRHTVRKYRASEVFLNQGLHARKVCSTRMSITFKLAGRRGCRIISSFGRSSETRVIPVLFVWSGSGSLCVVSLSHEVGSQLVKSPFLLRQTAHFIRCFVFSLPRAA